jgi:hypothetical protein
MPALRRLGTPVIVGVVALACDAAAPLDRAERGTGGAASIAGTASEGPLPNDMLAGGCGMLAGSGGVVGSGMAAAAGDSKAGQSGESAGLGGSAGGSTAGGAGRPAASGILCVFDYDLTLSTHACGETQSWCRVNTCITYDWYEQCISDEARRAVATCVERGAFIGIASHASVDACWTDKVSPIVEQMQLPELTSAARYAASALDFAYPPVDVRQSWNCDDCAYHMDSTSSKPQLIAKIMRHYAMDPNAAGARAHVILWDDMLDNIIVTERDMPEVTTVHVHQNVDGNPSLGGCGIREADIQAGWAPFGF